MPNRLLQAFKRAFLGESTRCDEFYAVARQLKPMRIVELGVANLDRTARLLEITTQQHPPHCVHFAGFDRYDSREPDPLSLKQAYCRLAKLGPQIRLIPGELVPCLMRTANELTSTDLLLIGEEVTDEQLLAMGPFVPRMLSPQAMILRFSAGSGDANSGGFEHLAATQFHPAHRTRHAA